MSALPALGLGAPGCRAKDQDCLGLKGGSQHPTSTGRSSILGWGALLGVQIQALHTAPWAGEAVWVPPSEYHHGVNKKIDRVCRGTCLRGDIFVYGKIHGLISCPPRKVPSQQSLTSGHLAQQHGGHTAPPDPTCAPDPTALPGPHPTLISACCLAVPWWLRSQHSPLCPSLYTPVIFNSAYANPESGMSSGRGPRGNGHGANFLPFLPLFLYNTQQRFSSTA